MINDIRQNKLDYSLLAVAAIAFLYTFFYFRYDHRAMFIAVLSFSTFYVLWGIFHHLRLGDCRLRIVLEYVLMAALATVLATTLLI